jgi:hypothetical protein
MSRQIFRDIEEAVSREVRRITFHNARTLSRTVLKDTFDPLTGELVQLPIEPDFYDSSADTKNIQYPHFFIKLIKSKEDLTSGRVVPQYGQWLAMPQTTSPKAFEIVIGGSDGTISITGNELKTSIFQVKKILPGYLLRLLTGNNVGTYIVDSIVVNNSGLHSVFVSQDLVVSLPSALFDTDTRILTFTSPADLNTIVVGDVFEDSASSTFNITAVNINNNSITVDGIAIPDLTSGGKISRLGDVFQSVDPTLVRFIVMDPTKPIVSATVCGNADIYGSSVGVSPPIPLDLYYLVRIDSKERDTHIDVLNRIWEEFNPPRTGLPVIIRSSLSAEQLLTADIPSGGSPTVFVNDNSLFNINEPVYIFDDLSPSKGIGSEFQRPFESKIVGKVSTNQVVLEDTVPDSYTIANNTKIVSNAAFQLLMFHFVDHITRDVEGAQYWVNEFTFWVQTWVDRLEAAAIYGVINDIATPIEDIEGNVIIEDP